MFSKCIRLRNYNRLGLREENKNTHLNFYRQNTLGVKLPINKSTENQGALRILYWRSRKYDKPTLSKLEKYKHEHHLIYCK